MKRKPKMDRDTLAAVAMHGILTACSSPQYVDNLIREAKLLAKDDIYERIAERAYNVADSMMKEGKRK